MIEQILASSRNTQQVSLMVRGVLLSFVPLALILLRAFGIAEVDETVVTQFIDYVAQILQAFFSLISLIMIAWGFIRKFIPHE